MVTVYTITYNEERLIEYFINHYRKNFPGCDINVFDNYSTDKTVEIAKKHNCNVIMYDTNNKLSDKKYLEIKNSCWKDSKTDWVIVCDCDELISINHNDLILESKNLVNLFKPEGYSIMNFEDELNLEKMVYGFRDLGFDKTIIFNKKHIKNINYGPGCHHCSPEVNDGYTLKYNTTNYKLIHYKYLHPNYSVERHKMFGERLSEDNKKHGWGIHYTFSSESIKTFYKNKEKELIKVI